MERKKIKPLILIFGIIAFFVFTVSFAVFYTTENFSAACGCNLPPWVMIVSLSSLGLFVGLITYYILSVNFIKEKKDIEKNVLKVLDLLEKDERKVIKHFIENQGETTQSSISKSLDFDKVKNSRIISKLEAKGIIEKEKQGMTNKLILNQELKNLFIK
jgi:uncharacterized membrane protein